MVGVIVWVRLIGYVYVNGGEHLVFSDNVNFQDNQGQYLLGYYDFDVYRDTSAKTTTYEAKITSRSTYVSGTKTSGPSDFVTAALASHTVSYNTNGGSWPTPAPGNQTKWYGSVLTLHGSSTATKPTRNGYTFQGWATSSGGSVAYQPGGQYGADADIILYAVWKANTYTVSYNANGGSGAPGSQTKTHGINLTLSSTKPTRNGYNFIGWATSSSGSVAYQPGGTYTGNAALALYAKWEVAYVKPRISNGSVSRCDSSGTITDNGTYLKCSFSWATDYNVSSVKIQYSLGSSSWTDSVVTGQSGKSGNVSLVIGGGQISIENSYNVRFVVTDSYTGGSNSTISSTYSIGTQKFPIDVKNGGTGVAIGKVAESDDLFDVGFYSRFRKSVELEQSKGFFYKQGNITESAPNDTGTADTARKTGVYSNSSTSVGVPQQYGALFVIENNAGEWIPSASNSWIWQFYLPTNGHELWFRNAVNSETFNEFMRIPCAITLYNNTSGSTGTITLSSSAANFNYIDIFYSYRDLYDVIRITNAKNFAIKGMITWGNGGLVQNEVQQNTISGTSITRSNRSYFNISTRSW